MQADNRNNRAIYIVGIFAGGRGVGGGHIFFRDAENLLKFAAYRMHMRSAGAHLRCAKKLCNIYLPLRENLPPRKIPAIRYIIIM